MDDSLKTNKEFLFHQASSSYEKLVWTLTISLHVLKKKDGARYGVFNDLLFADIRKRMGTQWAFLFHPDFLCDISKLIKSHNDLINRDRCPWSDEESLAFIDGYKKANDYLSRFEDQQASNIHFKAQDLGALYRDRKNFDVKKAVGLVRSGGLINKQNEAAFVACVIYGLIFHLFCAYDFLLKAKEMGRLDSNYKGKLSTFFNDRVTDSYNRLMGYWDAKMERRSDTRSHERKEKAGLLYIAIKDDLEPAGDSLVIDSVRVDIEISKLTADGTVSNRTATNRRSDLKEIVREKTGKKLTIRRPRK